LIHARRISKEDFLKTIVTLLLIATLIVGATWVITGKLRETTLDHDRRIAQLEQRPRFASQTLHVEKIATTTNMNRSIWSVEGTDTIYFAWLSLETFGTQVVNKSVMLTSNPQSKKSLVIERTSPNSCILTFWVEKNQIMLAPAACTAGSAEDHASIEAAVEIK
jgi:hypothetical protein